MMTNIGKFIETIRKKCKEISFKRRLRQMDAEWYMSEKSCWGLFPPSFYYTHTEEEIKQITAETLERTRKLIDDL